MRFDQQNVQEWCNHVSFLKFDFLPFPVARRFLTLPDALPSNGQAAPFLTVGSTPRHSVEHTWHKEDMHQETWLLLPAARVQLAEVNLTAKAIRRLGKQIANALEDHLLHEPGSVHVTLAKTPGGGVQHAAIVEREWLREAVDICRRSGLELKGALPEPLYWRLPEASWIAYWDGKDGWSRTGTYAAMPLDGGDTQAPPLALLLAADEARLTNRAPSALLMADESAPMDEDAWSEALGIPVRRVILEIDTRAPSINLLEGEFTPQGRKGIFARYRPAALLVATALTLHLTGMLVDWARLSWEVRSLKNDIRQVFLGAFPETQVVIDPYLQTRRQLETLRQARGIPSSTDILTLLDHVTMSGLDLRALHYQTGKLDLELAEDVDLASLQARLSTAGYRMTDTITEHGAKRASIALE